MGTLTKADLNNNSLKIEADYWQQCYDRKYTRWQVDDVHKVLVKYIHLLEPDKSSTIFVPLCGKTVDIRWLYSRGHTILAADIIEEAILEQFRLLNIKYHTEKVSNDLTIYESDDNRVKILKCDFLHFDCSKYANTVEYIWDRASIFALDEDDQKCYVSQIKKMLKPKFNYLLETLTYDESKMNGPPFCVTKEKVEQYYGDICKIVQLENEATETMAFGVPATYHAFYLTNK